MEHTLHHTEKSKGQQEAEIRISQGPAQDGSTGYGLHITMDKYKLILFAHVSNEEMRKLMHSLPVSCWMMVLPEPIARMLAEKRENFEL